MPHIPIDGPASPPALDLLAPQPAVSERPFDTHLEQARTSSPPARPAEGPAPPGRPASHPEAGPAAGPVSSDPPADETTAEVTQETEGEPADKEEGRDADDDVAGQGEAQVAADVAAEARSQLDVATGGAAEAAADEVILSASADAEPANEEAPAVEETGTDEEALAKSKKLADQLPSTRPAEVTNQAGDGPTAAEADETAAETSSKSEDDADDESSEPSTRDKGHGKARRTGSADTTAPSHVTVDNGAQTVREESAPTTEANSHRSLRTRPRTEAAQSATAPPVPTSGPSGGTEAAGGPPVAEVRAVGEAAAETPRAAPPTPRGGGDLPARLVHRVAGAVRVGLERGGTIRLRLAPPELGRLQIEVQLERGELAGRFEAETAAARNLLLENLPALRQRLSEQGIRLGQLEIDLMDASAGDGSRQDGPKSDPGAAPDNASAPGRTAAAGDEPNETSAPTGSRRPTGGDQRLDLFV